MPAYIVLCSPFHVVAGPAPSSLSRTKNPVLLLQRPKGLLAWLAGLAAKDELSGELPRRRDGPLLLDLLVDEGVVVLEVGAQAFGFEGGPDCELEHGA